MIPLIAIPLPWALIAVLATALATGSLGYWKGGEHKANAIAAQDARDMQLMQLTQSVVAQELSKLRIEHQTIRQKTEVITREVPVYRDCQHDAGAYGLLNDALTPPERRVLDGGAELSRTDAAR